MKKDKNWEWYDAKVEADFDELEPVVKNERGKVSHYSFIQSRSREFLRSLSESPDPFGYGLSL